MPTLTGLPALIKRVQVLAGSALTWLGAILAVLVVLAQQLENFGGVPEWVTKAIASAIAVIGVAVLQVRRVTPVSDADKGLLPPKGPAAEADPNRDIGAVGARFLLLFICVVLLLVLGAWAAGIIDFGEGISVPITLSAFAAACWVLASMVTDRADP